MPPSNGRARQDTLSAIGTHVSAMTSRIQRLSAAHQWIQRALVTATPQGLSRLDWIARRLSQT
ncbi:hypothetical protein A3E39_01485 [Candidatus Uhrbacteria bacterium RIFCSPHIGHO2_12_FULL_60_25]|uniref:Uncharacterized protein n=1 Tax=Candidatus Uhrbacteria bacterium RIFCSPHIGHO2_12_FULL_60_25 TaxID=1802399 RepID=A0A1F7UJQ1_9BACT|nr:MAG: hypothetical protein A3D73_04085 [Candidatus Uhrbacteria bacterium RIFCSPHIGHO2_02_FULL_60_44]OGL78513.1 MAG: hypothetical protein A3E39_01485 [Candidatus Uhrbacteria bacterium RIFCSPHIGHO2_12_FULL_60_25]